MIFWIVSSLCLLIITFISVFGSVFGLYKESDNKKEQIDTEEDNL